VIRPGATGNGQGEPPAAFGLCRWSELSILRGQDRQALVADPGTPRRSASSHGRALRTLGLPGQRGVDVVGRRIGRGGIRSPAGPASGQGRPDSSVGNRRRARGLDLDFLRATSLMLHDTRFNVRGAPKGDEMLRPRLPRGVEKILSLHAETDRQEPVARFSETRCRRSITRDPSPSGNLYPHRRS